MADQSDIENLIAQTVSGIVYPNGTNNPSIINAPVKIYRGWPVEAKLDPDLATGTSHITIWPVDGTEANTTRFHTQDWHQLTLPNPTLSWVTSGLSTTLVGDPTHLPLNVAIVAAGHRFGSYGVQTGDTLTSICTNLKTSMLANGFTSVSASGSTITVGDAVPSISPRVGTSSSSAREIGRQRKDFMISFWCPDPPTRDILVSQSDSALRLFEFLIMPDLSSARMYYHSSKVIDFVEKARLWRRDLVYTVEWATTQILTTYQIVVSDLRVRTSDASMLITEIVS